MLTLVRPPGPIEVVPPPVNVVLRSPSTSDLIALGWLYFASYDRGAASLTEADAIEDIRLSFAGEYGPLNVGISRLAVAGDELIGAILVDQAPWLDTPDGPFIIELFTATPWRRRGIARSLLTTVLSHTSSAAGLRVAEGNSPARGLYRSIGFSPWP